MTQSQLKWTKPIIPNFDTSYYSPKKWKPEKTAINAAQIKDD